MNTKPQHTLAEIGKAYSTAIIWVSRNRSNPSKFRRALSLEIFCLRQKGYFTRIKHTTIEG